jgi:hypothetical protein
MDTILKNARFACKTKVFARWLTKWKEKGIDKIAGFGLNIKRMQVVRTF